jgi:hypothetical protein
LTGKDSEKALREFLRQDTQLAAEIANRCGAAHLNQVLMTPAMNDRLEEEDGDFDTHDDSDVSFSSVVRDVLDISATGVFTDYPTAKTVSHTTESDGLATADETEDMWADADNGKA